jgi:hypothetical protein
MSSLGEELKRLALNVVRQLKTRGDLFSQLATFQHEVSGHTRLVPDANFIVSCTDHNSLQKRQVFLNKLGGIAVRLVVVYKMIDHGRTLTSVKKSFSP